ncbi:uncharacterized protein LOC131670256 isoform X2 [Phymastichus coffea]|uniref:uncharacterized protein LOC131670256 isoform X2 n=1 Tax=Phymastichus coffea TaxID=108790 RepID=UPI00273B8C80|nr:uncharacterized protein LOC131670256 isoform X2 [Phymastichus coffea]
MKKAGNAAIRINSLHMAKGKIKTIDGNNKLMPSSNGGYKGTEMFTTEFEINETPPSARTLLTKGYIQDEINSFSGATVSTRGRFMTEQEKARCPHERPLYLYIQGHSKHNIDLAVQKINDIIKTEHRSSLNRPSRFTNAPPPLMSLHSGVPTVEKLCIGIENAPQGFDLRGRIIGVGGANLLYIRGETGATVSLRGRGSQLIDPGLGTESPEPLHLCIEHPNPVALQNAKQLAINLIQTIQSELQSYIQQQPPPVQQQVIQQPPMQQIQPAQFQTMTIGQPSVVTIHQDMIPHPQSTVVSMPATIITATVAGTHGQLHPTGVHIAAPAGPMPQSDQPQEMQTFVPPPAVGQVQLIGPPPGVNQVQYQIHPGQPLPMQGMPPPGSQNSPQPMTQMYVMSQPPPQQTFISSSAGAINGAVSYVYTQPRSATPTQTMIETVNVNLQQPPPSGPINVNQQPPPPPSLMHVHFPPPFPPNQPPPPISQTYQIQYQPVQTSVAQAPTQFIVHHSEAPPQQMPPNHEPPQGMGPPPPPPQHMPPPQFDGQPPPPQMQMHAPPPASQGYMVPTSQAMAEHGPQPPLPPPGGEMQHPQDGPVDQGMPPQPVPPPQMVPPPAVNQMQHSMNIITSVPPPSHPPPQAAPWLYQGQPLPQPPPPQGQMQVPASNVPHHPVPPPEMQPQMQYHPHQPVHYQNGQMQPPQMHYAVQPPPPQSHFDQNSDLPEHHKGQGLKRRFSDVDGPPEPMMHPMNRPPTQRHGAGEGDQQQHVMHGPPGANLPPGERKQLLMPPPYQDERRGMDQPFPGHNPGCEQPMNGEHGRPPPPPPGMPWQTHFARYPPNRPPPMPREGEQHPVPYHGAPPPINMPPPPPQMRLVQGSDGSRSPSQNALPEHQVSGAMEYNLMSPYTAMKPPPPPAALVASICNPPPPPPSPPTYTQSRHPPRMHHPRYHASAPPWMN